MLLGAFCIICALAPGQLAITPDHSATSGLGIYRDGAEIGRYIDNEEPHQADLVAQSETQGLVIAGIWPACDSQPNQSCGFPGAINAREFYPFGIGQSVAQLPAAEAYIVQWDFAWPGQSPPTEQERWQLLCAAYSRHPSAILLYQSESVPTLAEIQSRCDPPLPVAHRKRRHKKRTKKR